jgi:transcriptional regulator with XRE-family HTH domain
MTQTSVAERLRVLRARKGITVREAARRAGVDRHTLRRLETGVSKQPGYPTLKKIADFYGLTVPELMEEEDAVPKVPAPSQSGRGVEVTEEPAGEGKAIRIVASETVAATDEAVPLIHIGEFEELLVEAGLDQETAEWTAERVFAMVGARRDR